MLLRYYIRGILKEILLGENRIKNAKAKYPSVENRLDNFIELPSKYIEWIAKQLFQSNPEESRLKQAILTFDSMVAKNKIDEKDINKYETLDALEAAIAEVNNQTALPPKAKVFYRDSRFSIIQPLNKEASCKYGKNTKWCISATKTKNFWDSYTKSGAEFFFVFDNAPQQDNWNKVAFSSVQNSDLEIYDASDTSVETSSVFSYYPPVVLDALAAAMNNSSFSRLYQEQQAKTKFFNDVPSMSIDELMAGLKNRKMWLSAFDMLPVQFLWALSFSPTGDTLHGDRIEKVATRLQDLPLQDILQQKQLANKVFKKRLSLEVDPLYRAISRKTLSMDEWNQLWENAELFYSIDGVIRDLTTTFALKTIAKVTNVSDYRLIRWLESGLRKNMEPYINLINPAVTGPALEKTIEALMILPVETTRDELIRLRNLVLSGQIIMNKNGIADNFKYWN